jgi:DMSO/TMAO reductase YedYZ molybdopterin-dependent catalytic subunit
MAWQGVSFFSIADLVKPTRDATHVFFKSYDGYSTNNPLDVCMDDDVLIAHSLNGKPLAKEHGGPARVILPKRYAWKGAKFVWRSSSWIATSSVFGNCAATRTRRTRGRKIDLRSSP